MSIKVSDKQIQELIEYLQGTCKSLSEGLDAFDLEEDDLTDEQRQTIDDEIFNCSKCGWWCEISQEVGSETCGELVCDDCFEDEEDEDEEDE